jgi:hypothetical protein
MSVKNLGERPATNVRATCAPIGTFILTFETINAIGPSGNADSAELKYMVYDGEEFIGSTDHSFYPAKGLDRALQYNDNLKSDTALPVKIVYSDGDQERCTIQDLFYDWWTSQVRVETRACL